MTGATGCLELHEGRACGKAYSGTKSTVQYNTSGGQHNTDGIPFERDICTNYRIALDSKVCHKFYLSIMKCV